MYKSTLSQLQNPKVFIPLILYLPVTLKGVTFLVKSKITDILSINRL